MHNLPNKFVLMVHREKFRKDSKKSKFSKSNKGLEILKPLRAKIVNIFKRHGAEEKINLLCMYCIQKIYFLKMI